jgi:DNA-binding NarL/FixJ family response regulator
MRSLPRGARESSFRDESLIGLDWTKIAARLHLSRREIEIVQEVCNGRTDKAIARTLGISLNTVREHQRRIHRKLGVHDRASLVLRIVAASART